MLRNYRNVLDLSNLGNFCLICFIFAIPDKVTPLKSLHGFVRRRRHCTYPPPCVKSDKNEGKAAVIPKVGKAILFLRTATGNSVRVAGFEILPVPVQWRAVGHWQYNVLDVSLRPSVCLSVCLFVRLLPTCERYTSKTNEPISMQICINRRPRQGHERSSGVRRSKFKVAGGRSYIWKPGGDVFLFSICESSR